MHSDIDEQVIIERDCEATLIPFGNKVTLKKGEEGHITQALGGSYTVMVRGNLVRIEGVDADAIGKIPEVQPWLEETEADGKANEKAVWDAMKTCYDPEIPIDLWNLGLIYDIEIKQNDNGISDVKVVMSLTTPGCTMGQHMAEEKKAKVSAMQEIGSVDVEVTFDPPWRPEMMTDEAREKLGFDDEVQKSQQEQLETTWE